jgi:conjugal transfer pilus assembly protein TraK
VSFFGTTQKGYVYKFNCRVAGDEAKQVFVANADVVDPQVPAAQLPVSANLNEQAVGLVKAMFEQRRVQGFQIEDQARAPVNVGALKVQLVSQYLSPTLAGKVLRIENSGTEAVTLKEELVASDGAIAVSISNPQLEPGQATAAYVVVPAGAF